MTVLTAAAVGDLQAHHGRREGAIGSVSVHNGPQQVLDGDVLVTRL